MGKNVPVADFAVWRYQIHIGGNSSAWSGLFQELITASPVLKGPPPRWRQWYSERLEPFVSFVSWLRIFPNHSLQAEPLAGRVGSLPAGSRMMAKSPMRCA